MSWNDWPSWLKCGVVFAFFNIILSIFAFSLPAIRNPNTASDLQSLYFPNILLGLPAILIGSPVLSLFKPLLSVFLGHNSTDGAATTGTELLSGLDSASIAHFNLFVQLFLFLTIYWFLIGSLIGLIYGRFKQRKD